MSSSWVMDYPPARRPSQSAVGVPRTLQVADLLLGLFERIRVAQVKPVLVRHGQAVRPDDGVPVGRIGHDADHVVPAPVLPAALVLRHDRTSRSPPPWSAPARAPTAPAAPRLAG